MQKHEKVDSAMSKLQHDSLVEGIEIRLSQNPSVRLRLEAEAEGGVEEWRERPR